MQPGENAGIFGSFARGRMISKQAIQNMRDRLDRQDLQRLQMKESFKDLCKAVKYSTTAYTRAMSTERHVDHNFKRMFDQYNASAGSGKKHVEDVIDGRFELEY